MPLVPIPTPPDDPTGEQMFGNPPKSAHEQALFILVNNNPKHPNTNTCSPPPKKILVPYNQTYVRTLSPTMPDTNRCSPHAPHQTARLDRPSSFGFLSETLPLPSRYLHNTTIVDYK